MLRWMPDFEMMTNQKFPFNLLLNPPVCHVLPSLCEALWRTNACSHPSQTNSSRIEVYMGAVPAGTSYANVRHYSQTLLRDRFAKFDYGEEKNQKLYGRPDPPDYDLAKVSGKVAVFYCAGDADIYAGRGHNEWLLRSLPKSSLVHEEVVHDFEHADFQLGINAKQVLFEKMIKVMRKYEKNPDKQ